MDVCAITNHTWWSSPLKLLEYGSLGKAVVAPDLPSITSMVSADEVRLFPVGDFHAFAAACSGLLADAEARRQLGTNLLLAVEARYSPAAMAARIRGSLARLETRG
jgi:glycosyltransferase involved in cell wall biosynthesis